MPWCLIIVCLCSCFGLVNGESRFASAAPEVPGAPQSAPIVLVGATIHPVNGPIIENGQILFDQGKIVALGKNLPLPENVERIDVAGKHVYPGLIDSFTDLGLVEIEAVRASNDHSETGEFNPNVKAQVSVNPDSELFPVTRANGVLTVLTLPNSGLIAGQSALMSTDGWTHEEMTILSPAALHINWPWMLVTAAPNSEAVKQQSAALDATLKRLTQYFDQARAYAKAKQAQTRAGTTAPVPAHDLRLEAMLPVLEGKIPVAIHADELRQIQAAVHFAVEQKIRMILVGGYDSPRCADLLKQHNIPVVVTATNRLPQRRGDFYDEAFTIPAQLHQAGITFCIGGEGKNSQARNLPYHAATAAAYGLPPEEALKAITLSPAKIFGVEGRIGSLEAGKEATLIITDGDPLEIPTQVTAAFIQGKKVELSDRHKRLWRKYQEKYKQLKR